MLVGPVVVGAVAEGGLDAEGPGPGADEEVGAGFGGGVGAGGVQRGGFVEFGGVVEFEVAVDFVGGNVVEAFVVFADGFEDVEGADDVGLDERSGVVEGVVVV